MDTRDQTVDWELRVLQGMHTGAALRLVDQAVSIGSDPGCDVLLLDAGVLPRHLTLEQDEAQGWRVLSQGEELPLHAPIPVGEAVLMVTWAHRAWHSDPVSGLQQGPDKTPSSAPQSHARLKWIAAGCLCALFAAVVWSVAALLAPVPRPPAHTAEVRTLQTLNETASAIETLADQPVQAEAESPALPFKIRQIVLGPVSFVVLDDGRRVFEGQWVQDHQLQAIRAGEMVWAGRDASRLMLPW